MLFLFRVSFLIAFLNVYFFFSVPKLVGGKVITQGARTLTTANTTPVQQPSPKVLIRSVQQKTIISANNVKITNQESPATSSVQSTSGVQKIITSSGHVITQQTQGNIISSTNLQQLLQRGNVTPGQKIVVQSGLGGVQKLLVTPTSTSSQIQQTGEKRIIIQNASGQQQQYILQNQSSPAPQQQPHQQFVTIGGQKLILQTSGSSSQVQQIKTVTSSVQQPQQIQFQIQEASPQQSQQQQIVVHNNGSNIAQQMAQGKIQVMNLNGQQVLVKSVGNNQSVIVGQVKTSTAQVTPVKQNIQATVVSSPSQQIVKTVQIQSTMNTGETAGVSEQSLMLANHPPGTIVKCVTAQVMQTPSGPRIVLQGLQGSDISPQQSQVLQQQVKQQLMKGK